MKTKLLFIVIYAITAFSPILIPNEEIGNSLHENKIEFDEATNTIYVDFYFPVRSSEFVYANDFIPITSKSDYKALAFRYYDTNNPSVYDNGEEKHLMHVSFNFIKPSKWSIGNDIRLISLNEDNTDDFHNLNVYFEERAEVFMNESATIWDIIKFDAVWNLKNTNNQVLTRTSDPIKKNKPNKIINKSLENYSRPYKPKLTKQDMIVKITRK